MLRQLPDFVIEPAVRAALLEDLGRAGEGLGQGLGQGLQFAIGLSGQW